MLQEWAAGTQPRGAADHGREPPLADQVAVQCSVCQASRYAVKPTSA